VEACVSRNKHKKDGNCGNHVQGAHKSKIGLVIMVIVQDISFVEVDDWTKLTLRFVMKLY
jgi:hypothetical protein